MRQVSYGVRLRSTKKTQLFVATVAAATMLLLSTACSDPATTVADETGAAAAASQQTTDDGSASTTSAQDVYRPTRPQATDDSTATDLVNGTDKKSSGKLRPLDFPYEKTVKVTASLAPQCVDRGDKIDLSVTAPPEAAIAYQAIYSDGRSGSEPPFGQGYGGNDKGYGDDEGHYSSSFVIGPTAPLGRARVDVFVGFKGEWGYEPVRFAVADQDGNCPQRWFKGEES